MGNLSNDEALDGLQKLNQLMHPLEQMLRQLENGARGLTNYMQERTQQISEYFSSVSDKLQGSAETQTLRDTIKRAQEIVNQKVHDQIILLRQNGMESLAQEAEVKLNLMNQDIQANINELQAKAWAKQPYTANINNISKDLASIDAMAESLAQDNLSHDYSKTKENTEQCYGNSACGEKDAQRTEYTQWNSEKTQTSKERDAAEKTTTKTAEKATTKTKSELEKRFDNARQESAAFNAAKGNPVKDVAEKVADSVERALV